MQFPSFVASALFASFTFYSVNGAPAATGAADVTGSSSLVAAKPTPALINRPIAPIAFEPFPKR
ncbi:hypothetical protein BDN72DRAFT_895949 [Pluteus cervinus]|uniref:Uncharacterized protein n=1 Tax=Pluteus cervinus TaxID=181527 RepID=A0ACD3AZD4_9AGAR|nr:hypothetical protein BDN72DRAFT_895949 [Pluteus cervinus]